MLPYESEIGSLRVPPDKTAAAFLFAKIGVSLIADTPLSTVYSIVSSFLGERLTSPGTRFSEDKSALYSAVSMFVKLRIYISGSFSPSWTIILNFSTAVMGSLVFPDSTR